ncbi:unnamed protein product [Protopolystoma xenopodis]|uniref:Uncharacterized protein n=1 Tax=Protopolystoma xenopodis TaxID=117903 RepID=A0A448WHU5_9PLAT|nr:unnamed protein product [Protopolystoma xenopodis]
MLVCKSPRQKGRCIRLGLNGALLTPSASSARLPRALVCPFCTGRPTLLYKTCCPVRHLAVPSSTVLLHTHSARLRPERVRGTRCLGCCFDRSRPASRSVRLEDDVRRGVVSGAAFSLVSHA